MSLKVVVTSISVVRAHHISISISISILQICLHVHICARAHRRVSIFFPLFSLQFYIYCVRQQMNHLYDGEI